jgi:peptidoglycan hydrolase-like protein with peptidoglycan-binding domain
VAVKNDREASLSARLQGSTADTQILAPSPGDGRLSGDGERGGGDLEPPEPARRRRRTRVAAVGAIALVVVAVVLAVLLRSQHKPRAGASSGVPAGDTTVSVQRRTLTEHAQVNGTLGYGSTLELYDRIGGTFTWLPSVGSVIGRGGTLFKIDQLPIVLMYGSVPAYRALKEGVSDGEDVSQLNENLVALGYDPYGAITDYENFSEATAAAVRRWQKAEGLPQTGEVELGRVVFAPSARRVTAVKPTLGQDPPGDEGSQAPSGAKETASKEPASKEGPSGKAPTREGPAEDHEAPTKKTPKKEAPKKEVSEKETGASNKEAAHKEDSKKEALPKEASAKEAPAKEAAKDPGAKEDGPSKGEPSGEGSSGGAGEPVLVTTSTQQTVQLQVETDQQQLAHVGASAPVTLPSGQTVKAHITSVGTVASESGGGGEGGKGGESGKATISVTLALEHRVPHLDAAPVTVELVKEKRRNVLTIPATALIATAGGGYAVEAIEGQRSVEVPVTPGMFADGYVQIEGEGVREGLKVTEPAEE